MNNKNSLKMYDDIDNMYTIKEVYEKNELVRRELIFDVNNSYATVLLENNKYLLTEPAWGDNCRYYIGYCIWIKKSKCCLTEIIADFQGNKEEAEDYFKTLELFSCS